ncbi:hypothetical protein BDR05DRAFT_1038907, partial [Suillus weaverae]
MSMAPQEHDASSCFAMSFLVVVGRMTMAHDPPLDSWLVHTMTPLQCPRLCPFGKADERYLSTSTVMQQVVSTTLYRQRLYASISTTNALPAPRNQSEMNTVLDEELDGHVVWEERSTSRGAASVMDAIFIQSNLTLEDISGIKYQPFISSGRRNIGAPVFIPAGRGAGGTWQLDRKNVQPRSLAGSSASRKQMPHKKLRSQTSTAASALTDTEVEESDSSLTAPDTDKSFNAQEYNVKNLNNKRVKTSATAEGRWTLLFNTMQAD